MSEISAIGIDLGTTFSCAAVVDESGTVKMIRGDDGNYIMASSVFFEETGEHIVGNLAKEKFYKNPRQGIYGVKRFIGRTYNEYELQKDKLQYAYNIVNQNDQIKIAVKCPAGNKYFAPEEISAMVLTKLVDQAEEVLGKRITKAVISVPAHFNGCQRQSTRDAAKIAGLEVLRLINEPTAAAMAFELHNKYKSCTKNILIYDFGGGTFDVTIATIDKGDIIVKATNGEPYLGGDDINNNMVDYLVEVFNHQHHINLKHYDNYNNILLRLQHKVEKAKIYLSQATSHHIDIDELLADKSLDFEHSITRSKFENLNKALFKKTLNCIEGTLKDAGMDKTSIDEIVLVGGTTRIPYIRKMIKEYFGKEINTSVHPDEAVALGAARQAALSSCFQSSLRSIKLHDVCSLSLGTDVVGDIMSIIITRNTPIPAKRTMSYETTDDNQSSMNICIFEGEREIASENRPLATFEIQDLTPALKGQTNIELTYDLDENGLLKATAVEVGRESNSAGLNINVFKNQLSEEEINEMIADAERYRKVDKVRKEKSEAKLSLVDTLYDLRKALIEAKSMSQHHKKVIMDTTDGISEWLKSFEKLSISQIKDKETEIVNICRPLIRKYV